MTLTGIKDFLPFLEFLRDHRIWFRVDSLRDDAVNVEIHLVGVRLEVEFFEDHIEYSVFTGDESVLDDQKQLFDLIIERGTEGSSLSSNTSRFPHSHARVRRGHLHFGENNRYADDRERAGHRGIAPCEDWPQERG